LYFVARGDPVTPAPEKNSWHPCNRSAISDELALHCVAVLATPSSTYP
jgi:hypothetical protein